MTLSIETLISLALGVLLVAMIVSTLRLNRRLAALRDGQGEMRALIESLNAATERAQSAISLLRSAAQESEQRLNSENAKARALADELALITAAGDNLALRLEQRLTGAPAALANNEEKARATILHPSREKNETPGDPEIVRALRGVR